MGDHPTFILDHPYLYKEKSIEELAESLWLTTMELEANMVRVQEEIKARDDRLTQLKRLLNDAIIERNEARTKYQSLLLDKLHLQQQFDHHHGRYKNHQTVSCVEDEPITNCGFYSSDCEESEEANPGTTEENAVKGLPENGKFLEAVMKAGPLLNNLLLAGALPHWRQPPPRLDAYTIPSPQLVIPTQSMDYLRSISSKCCDQFSKKRVFCEDSDSSTETKYQRIYLN